MGPSPSKHRAPGVNFHGKGKRYKNSLETVGTPDSGRGRSEKKAINDLDRDFWNNNESTVQQKWSSYPPKEFILNISPYAPYGDPRLSLNSTGEPKCQRPRTLTRQQSLQQPLSQHQRGRQPSQPTTSQSLGQLQAHAASVPGPNPRAHGRGQARQGSSAGSKYRPAGGRSRSNPGSWDHVVGQIRNRGLDMKSFLLWELFSTPRSFLGALYMEQETSTLSLGEEKGRRKGKDKVKAQLTGKM